MAVGELLVSIFPDYIVLEMFQMKSKKKTLISKHFEKYSVPLLDMNKVDAMDIEKIIESFLIKGKIKRGKVNVVVFGNGSTMTYHELEMETTKKKEIKNMLPLEIENLGEEYSDFNYVYDVLGSKVKTYFLKKNIIEHISSMKFPNSWEFGSLIPSFLAYQGMVPSDGIVLDINKDTYTIYGFRSGYICDIETGSVYTEFSMNRPVDPSPDELFDNISDDVRQYVSNFNFKESLEIDLVYVVFNDNVKSKFNNREIDGICFEKVRDLRNWLSVDEELEVAKDHICEIFDYSSVSLGVTYLSKKLDRYDFSPEKIGIAYKNILVSSVSFSLMLIAVLPSFSVLLDNQLGAHKKEVKAYEDSIVKYEELLNGLGEKIKASDKQIEDYNDYVSSLEKLSNVDRNFISNVLKYLPDNTPSSILVQEIRLSKGSKDLLLKGLSRNYKDIGAFAIQLEKFGTVNIKNIDNNELLNKKGYPFEIELRSK